MKPEWIERLQELVDDHGGQERFAKAIGYTKGSISKLLAGKSQKLSKKFLAAIERADIATADWLLKGLGLKPVEKETSNETRQALCETAPPYKTRMNPPLPLKESLKSASIAAINEDRLELLPDIVAILEKVDLPRAAEATPKRAELAEVRKGAA